MGLHPACQGHDGKLMTSRPSPALHAVLLNVVSNITKRGQSARVSATLFFEAYLSSTRLATCADFPSYRNLVLVMLVYKAGDQPRTSLDTRGTGSAEYRYHHIVPVSSAGHALHKAGSHKPKASKILDAYKQNCKYAKRIYF